MSLLSFKQMEEEPHTEVIDVDTKLPWNPYEGISCCWDNGPFSETETRLPVIVGRSKNGDFLVKGHVCSANCAKSIIMAGTDSQKVKTYKLGLQQMMWREHFNLIEEPIAGKPKSWDMLCNSFAVLPAPNPRDKTDMYIKGGLSTKAYRRTFCRIKTQQTGPVV